MQEAAKSNKKRYGETKIIYEDGKITRALWGKIIKRTEWGIKVARKDGTVSLRHDQVKRIEERGIECPECTKIVTYAPEHSSVYCYDCQVVVDD